MTSNHSFTTKKRRLTGGETLNYGSALDWQQEIGSSSGVSASSGKVVPASGTVISDGLIHHYTFADGTATDLVGSLDGTVNGPTHLAAGGPRSDGAFSNDGVDDYIEFPNSPSVNSSPLTVSLWVKTADGDGRIVGKRGDGWVGWGIRTSGGHVGFIVDDGSADSVNSTVTVADGAWHHVAMTYDGSVLKGYVDVFDEVSVVSSRMIANGSTMTLGDIDGTKNSGANKDPINADFDNLRIYDRVLNISELETVFDSEKP